MEAELSAIDKSGKLTIYRDEDTPSPREDDNLGKMVCWHKRYQLGDSHNYDTPQDFEESDEYKDSIVCLPLYLYDHSGIVISISPFIGREVYSEWDSGQVGYIYATKERVHNLLNIEPSEENQGIVAKILSDETELYNSFLQGDTYGFTLIDHDGSEIEQMGGFIGEIETVIPQMKEFLPNEYVGLIEQLERQTELYAAM